MRGITKVLPKIQQGRAKTVRVSYRPEGEHDAESHQLSVRVHREGRHRRRARGACTGACETSPPAGNVARAGAGHGQTRVMILDASPPGPDRGDALRGLGRWFAILAVLFGAAVAGAFAQGLQSGADVAFAASTEIDAAI